MDDGEFEVLLIQKPSNLAELHGIITDLLKEKLEDAAYITFFKSSKVTFSQKEKLRGHSMVNTVERCKRWKL